MFQVELTAYGQTIISNTVIIDGVILLGDYIQSIANLTDYSSYTVNLDIEACGNLKGTIGNIRLQDLSGHVYTSKTILFYIKDGNEVKIVAGYSQDTTLVQKTGQHLNLFLSLDFSVFTNGFLFASIQAGFSTATQNTDGLLHIENPDIASDDSYSVYSKQQVDALLLRNDTELVIGTQTASVASWTGVTKRSALYVGMQINYFLPYAGKAGSTLTLTLANGTNTDALPMYFRGATAITTHFPVGSLIQMTYMENVTIGTTTIAKGWFADSDYIDGNTTSYTSTANPLKAGTNGIYGRCLVMRTGVDTWESIMLSYSNLLANHVLNTSGFYTDTIFYTSGTTTVNAGANSSATHYPYYNSISYTNYFLDVTTTPLVVGKPVYLVGTLGNDGKFYLKTTGSYQSQEVTTTDIYLYLGPAFSTTTIGLMTNHPMFTLKNGVVIEVTVQSLLNAARIEEVNSAIPTTTSQLTNNSGFITSADIPSNISDFTNDAGYITSSDIPDDISAFNNDVGYLTSYTETDPTVPSWAKESSKPSYNLDEVTDGSTRKLSNYVPTTRKVNNKALSDDITLNLDDVNDGSTRKLSNYVPTTRKVNNKALSADITLNLDDISDGSSRKLSNYVPYGEIFSTINGFDGRRQWLFEVHNVFWAATQRYDVTMSGFATGATTVFFDGSFETQCKITAGNTGVITIAGKNGSKMFGGGYPYGYLEVGFYYTSIPESVTCRVYSDGAQNPGWHSFTLTNVDKNNNQALYRGQNTGFYGVTQMEITVVAKDGNDASVTEIAFYQTRGTLQQLAVFNKGIAQELYYNLTGPKFIVTGGTSSQFMKADGSLDSNTYITSASLPTNVSQLTNDAGYITSSALAPYELSANLKEGAYVDVDELTMTSTSTNLPTSKAVASYISGLNYATVSQIPTNVSQLNNDSGYLTQHQSIKTINNNSLVGTGNVQLDLGDHNVIESISVDGDAQTITNKNVDLHIPDDITSIETIGSFYRNNVSGTGSISKPAANCYGQFPTISVAGTYSVRIRMYSSTSSYTLNVTYGTNSYTLTASNGIIDDTRTLTLASGAVWNGTLPGSVASNTVIRVHIYETGVVVNTVGVAAVSNDYNDLDNIPTIPTATSQLTNDSGYLTQHQSLAGVVASAQYNSTTKKIEFYNPSNTKLNTDIDASAFIKDGMVDTVTISNGKLVISFNTDAGKEDIEIPISDIFDASNYYTKTETDSEISGAITALNLGTASTKNYSTDMNTAANLPTTSAITSYISNQNFATTSQLPTKTSDLTNDSGFVTSSDLSGYVPKVSSSTDNAIVRFDGTSSAIQNSGVLIDDSNNLLIPLGSSGTFSQNSKLVIGNAWFGSNTTGGLAYGVKSGSTYSSYYTFESTTFRPVSSSDNAIDIGTSSYRWKDLYIAGKICKNGTYKITIPSATGTMALVSDIPTKTSDLTNDSGYITSASVPTKTSDLTNDSGFITISSVPTKVSDLTNDSGFISTETDPTVPSWAKSPSKPTYTANEVGALPANTSIPSKTSDLTNDSGFITSADIPSIPTKTSQLTNDSGFITSSALSPYALSANLKEGAYVNVDESTTTASSTNLTTGKSMAAYVSSQNFATVSQLPTVNNATLTIQKNGTTVNSFTANASSNVTANITVPTTVAELTDASDYVTSDALETTVQDYLEDHQNIILAGNNITITTGSSILPTGYTQVEYIQSNGAAYLDTGLVPTDSTKIIVDIFNNSTGSFYVIGARATSSSTIILAQSGSATGSVLSGTFNGSSITAKTNNVNWSRTSAGQRYLITLETSNGTGFYEVEDITNNREFSSSTSYTLIGTVSTHILLCAFNSSNILGGTSKVYRCEIYQNDILAFQGIPCYRNSDGRYGLYDTVSSTFIFSSSSTQFTGSTELHDTLTISAKDEKAQWGKITGTLSNQTDLNTALGLKANSADLATVATSGSYNDLSNKPSIPTKTSQLTNDSGFITSASVPTKTSDLTNDSGFITSSDLPSNHVTTNTDQTVSGAKTFTATTKVASVDASDKSYINMRSSGGTSSTSATSGLMFCDYNKYGFSNLSFYDHLNDTGLQFYISTTKYDSSYNIKGESLIYQSYGHHYHVQTSETYIAFTDELPGAWDEFAADYFDKYPSEGSYTFTDDYQARIRLRKTVSDTNDSSLIYNGTHTLADIYANHINILGDDVHFNTLVNNEPSELLNITNTNGVYSTRFKGGYEIGSTQYSFGTAGSLTYETSVADATADNTHLPTSLAVKNYVGSKVPSKTTARSDQGYLYNGQSVDVVMDNIGFSNANNLINTSGVTAYVAIRANSGNPFLGLKEGSNLWYAQAASNYFYFGPTSTKALRLDQSGNGTFQTGTCTATGFKYKNGTTEGRSDQFLKADGSLDSNTYLTSFTETDPTVPSWAKQSTKPTYTASEVGALPDSTIIPSKTSELTNDSGFLTEHQDISGKQDVLTAGEGISLANNVVKTTGIPFGICDSTSTDTAFTVTVPSIYKLEDGVCCLVKNGVVTSKSGFTLNVNGLGAKPVYSNMAAETRETTIFNVAYTMLFVYDSTRVSGGCWICYRGYDSNTNTIGYQLRTNSSTLPVKFKTYRYRLYFTSSDGNYFVGANSSTSTNNTTARTPTTEKIDPFGRIIYYSTNGTTNSGDNLTATAIWNQYTVSIGYSFTVSLVNYKPVYVKCSPQSDGSAIIDSDTPIVQTLPSSNDGKIYILLGIAYSTTAFELIPNHPVYYHDGTGIRLWSGKDSYSKTEIDSSFVTINSDQTITSNKTLQYGKKLYLGSAYSYIAGSSNSGSIHICSFNSSNSSFYTEFNVTSNGLTLTKHSGTSEAPVTTKLVDLSYTLDANKLQVWTTLLMKGSILEFGDTSNNSIIYFQIRSVDRTVNSQTVKDTYLDVQSDGRLNVSYGNNIKCYVDTDGVTISGSNTLTFNGANSNYLTSLQNDNFTNTLKMTGVFAPSATETYTLGTSSLKWSNVYSTIFTGNLTGDVTGKFATARNINGLAFDGSADIQNFAQCTTDGDVAEKTATITGLTVSNGIDIYIHFGASNTATDPTLNINNTTAYPIYFGANKAGTTQESSWYSGEIVHFVFFTMGGGRWYAIGRSHAVFGYDTFGDNIAQGYPYNMYTAKSSGARHTVVSSPTSTNTAMMLTMWSKTEGRKNFCGISNIIASTIWGASAIGYGDSYSSVSRTTSTSGVSKGGVGAVRQMVWYRSSTQSAVAMGTVISDGTLSYGSVSFNSQSLPTFYRDQSTTVDGTWVTLSAVPSQTSTTLHFIIAVRVA